MILADIAASIGMVWLHIRTGYQVWLEIKRSGAHRDAAHTKSKEGEHPINISKLS